MTQSRLRVQLGSIQYFMAWLQQDAMELFAHSIYAPSILFPNKLEATSHCLGFPFAPLLLMNCERVGRLQGVVKR